MPCPIKNKQKNKTAPSGEQLCRCEPVGFTTCSRLPRSLEEVCVPPCKYHHFLSFKWQNQPTNPTFTGTCVCGHTQKYDFLDNYMNISWAFFLKARHERTVSYGVQWSVNIKKTKHSSVPEETLRACRGRSRGSIVFVAPKKTQRCSVSEAHYRAKFTLAVFASVGNETGK